MPAQSKNDSINYLSDHSEGDFDFLELFDFDDDNAINQVTVDVNQNNASFSKPNSISTTPVAPYHPLESQEKMDRKIYNCSTATVKPTYSPTLFRSLLTSTATCRKRKKDAASAPPPPKITLTPEEKITKTKLRNKASAQTHRDVKKKYIENLESENKRLKAENALLMTENTQLKAEKAQLMAENNQLTQDCQDLSEKNKLLSPAYLTTLGFLPAKMQADIERYSEAASPNGYEISDDEDCSDIQALYFDFDQF